MSDSRVRTKLYRGRSRHKQNKRSPIVLFLLLLLWSSVIAWGFTLLTQYPGQSQTIPQVSPAVYPASSEAINIPSPNPLATVDIVPQRYQLGQQLYLENCATCHIGLPPAVLPTETWRNLIQDEEHYGKKLKPLVDPERFLVWDYLRVFSRTQAPEEEQTPYRVAQSRYFKALHPRVKLPQPANMGSCVTCHPKVEQYDFRTLSSEWQNAP
ncbi:MULTISPECIES: diheme cytochrome c [Oscillatoriales]|uniref:diheme cytochrome c n=1 Tax=Oscillatoriophycideae TaxID=1301283 RepID=UPI001F555785|nr:MULTISPECIES: diheme cytochrome c [Oscillatoriales]